MQSSFCILGKESLMKLAKKENEECSDKEPAPMVQKINDKMSFFYQQE